MKHSLEMYRDTDNIIKYKGTITYFQGFSKSVEVDGEVFTKQWSEEVTKDVSDFESRDFYELDYEFKELGITEKIQELGLFSDGLSGFFYDNQSTNNEVNNILRAYKNGLLDERITGLTSGKRDYYSWWNRNYQFKNKSQFELFLFGYGFNNTVSYTIKLETLIQIPKNKLDPITKMWFTKHNINLNMKDKVELSLKLLTLKSKLK